MTYDGSTGCVKKAYQCELLRSTGYSEANIQTTPDGGRVTLPPMLAYGRFDFIIADMPWRDGRHVNWQGSEFVRLFDLETITTYVGAGPNLDPEVRRRLTSNPSFAVPNQP